MRKKSTRDSGVFTPRLLLGLSLCFLGGLFAVFSFASTPSSGTLSDSVPVLTYSAGPFNQPNLSPLGLGQLDTGPRCNAQFPCDNFALTVNLPAGYAAMHPNAAIKVSMSWTDTGTGNSDYDLYIYKGVVGNLNGDTAADSQSSSGANPEVATIGGLVDGTSQYSIKIVPYTPTGETVQVKIELLGGSGSGGGGGGGLPFGGADPTVPGQPRFQVFVPPAGSSAEVGNGEFNIGFNPTTGRIMNMNSGPILRLTPPERLVPAKPECCEGLWEDKSSTVTDVGLDPILWTDQLTGRTFASNSTVGANAVYAYSDNDGDTWIPFGVAAPNGGADHQTIGTGPYPAALSILTTPLNHGHAVYYCSQDIVGPAACYRSDDLGVTYGAPTLAYNGQGTGVPGGTACGGLHGHLHVAPDGTAWLPVNQCEGKQGGALTTNGGITWQEFLVPGSVSQTNGADPSIAIDSDSTVYYAYVNNEPVGAGNPPEGHARVKVGHRNTTTGVVTWTNDFDLGATHGIRNAVHIEAVGGSSGRAAVGFFGTDKAGDYQAIGFPGKWYAFISTTYNGGATWTTVNATPNDPVQSATGIWQQGGGATQRNLLDFNEITVDDKGRVLYGYSDGCVSADCIAGVAPNDYTAHMRVARQTGGKSIFASFDANTDTTSPILAKAACLSGTRDSSASHLTWKAPDNGGSDIVKYEIWRSTTAGAEQKLGETTTPITKYDDTTASPSEPVYYYYVKAVNGVGVAGPSNEIALPIGIAPDLGNICVAPGLLKLTDAAGDSLLTPLSNGTDILSVQIAQPYQTDSVPRITFTINTDPGMAVQPPGSAWYLAMRIVNGANTRYTGVRMEYSSTTPSFYSYVPGANSSGGVDGRFVDSKMPADSGSYAAPYTKIVITVKASDLGLTPGDTISGFIAGSSQSSDPANIGVGATEVYDSAPDSLTFTGTYTIANNNTACSILQSVVSRKVHGAAGTFDIPLPLVGNVGLESRSGPHTLIYTLDRSVTAAGIVTVLPSGGGTASLGPNPNQVTVNLTGIPNAQHITVTLNGVQDAAANVLNNLAARMDVLLGDVDASGRVDGGDVLLTRQQNLQTPTTSNFRADVNASGRIDGGDVLITRNQNLTSLPAANSVPQRARTAEKTAK